MLVEIQDEITFNSFIHVRAFFLKHRDGAEEMSASHEEKVWLVKTLLSF